MPKWYSGPVLPMYLADAKQGIEGLGNELREQLSKNGYKVGAVTTTKGKLSIQLPITKRILFREYSFSSLTIAAIERDAGKYNAEIYYSGVNPFSFGALKPVPFEKVRRLVGEVLSSLQCSHEDAE